TTINNATVTLPNALVGIGTASPIAALSVTHPIALGLTGKAVAIFNQIENEDILTASAGGITKFTVANNGDLITSGGVNATGNIITAGSVAANGGDLTTTASTATLFNTNATTVNIGGAATTVSLGASTGTTTIPGNLTISKILTANGQTNLSPSGTNGVT